MVFSLSKEMEAYLKGFEFPDVILKDWMEMHQITASIIPCDKCKQNLKPLIPISSTLDRGVVYESCKCGDMPPVTLVSASTEERKQDMLLFRQLEKELK